MKITIWIRPAKSGRDMTLRTDAKLETHDTPVIQNFGNRLIAAVKSGGVETEEE